MKTYCHKSAITFFLFLLGAASLCAGPAHGSEPYGQNADSQSQALLVESVTEHFLTKFHEAVLRYNTATPSLKMAMVLEESKELEFLKSDFKAFNKRRIEMPSSGEYYEINYPGVKVQLNAYAALNKFLLVNGNKISFDGAGPQEVSSKLKAIFSKDSTTSFFPSFMSSAWAKKGFEHDLILSIIALDLELEKLQQPMWGSAWTCKWREEGCEWQRQAENNLKQVLDRINTLANKCEEHARNRQRDVELEHFVRVLASVSERSSDYEYGKEVLNYYFTQTFDAFEGEDSDADIPLLTCDRLVSMIDDRYPSGAGNHPLRYGGIRPSADGNSYLRTNQIQQRCQRTYARLESCLVENNRQASSIYDQTERLPKEYPAGFEQRNSPRHYKTDSQTLSQ